MCNGGLNLKLLLAVLIQGLHSLEKSLNFRGSPWIFFSFECSGLESVFLMPFGRPRQNMNHSSENLKVIYTKCPFRLNVLCNNNNYQFKASELENAEKLVKQTVQALKPY